MAGLGLLLGGLAGAGRGAAQVGAEDQRALVERDMAAERSRLEEERALRIDEARRSRERAGALKMGEDISAETTRAQNQADADAINAKFGTQMTAEDAAALRGNEEARKAYGLLAGGREGDLEARANAAERLGYLEAARETRGQLQVEQQGKRYDKEFESRERRADLAEKVAAENEQFRRRAQERQDRLAESQIAFQKARASKEDQRYKDQSERELRLATRDALAGVNNQLKSLEKEAADPLLAPEQKEAIRNQMRELRIEGERYRGALAGAGLEGSMAPSKPFNPADFAFGGKSEAPAQRSAAPAAARPAPAPAPEPARRASPREMALQGYEAAIAQTAQQLAAAQNRGDNAEVARLNDLLQQQQAAKARTVQ